MRAGAGFGRDAVILQGMRLIILIIFTLVLFVSCDRKKEAIPAYLHIDSLTFKAGPGRGNDIQEFAAVYCYLGDNLLGIFETPVDIPILAQGLHRIQLFPAVRLNGSRSNFAMYKSARGIDTLLQLNPRQVTKLSNAQFGFRSNANLRWMEDFEDNNSKLVDMNKAKGDTSLIASEYFELNGKYAGNSLVYEIQMKGTDTLKIYDLQSFEKFDQMPTDGTDIMLEFDIKTPIGVQLALRRENSVSDNYVPYLFINPTNGEWKRFYTNLVYEIGGQPGDSKYTIIFAVTKLGGYNPGDIKIMIDNIRLSYLN